MQKQSRRLKPEEEKKGGCKGGSSSRRLEQRQAAQDLFVYSARSQKEIAQMIGVSEQTVVRWKDEGKWEEIKGANNLTASQVISNLYKRALELSKDPTSNADKIAKLAAAIDRLKPTKNTLTGHIASFMDFGDWAKRRGFVEEVKILNRLQKLFIEDFVNV